MKTSSFPQKVSFFVVSLNGGGAERVMVTLANSIAMLGVSVDLVVGYSHGPYLKEVNDAVKIVELKQERAVNCFWPLVRYLKIYKPDILFSTMNYVNIVAILANVLAGRNTKVVVREAATFSKNIGTASFLVRMILPKLVRVLYPIAHGIVAVSNGVKQDLITSLKLKSNDIRVIYNPIDFVKLTQLAELELQHRWYQQAEKKKHPIILAVGRFSPEKDYTTLLKAFALVVKQRVARLIILGDGPELSRTLELAKQLGIEHLVDFPGFIDNPFSYMKQSDVFVLSSNQEGMPNSLLQATILGCRIVSTDCKSGPNEILENGKYGRLVPVGDYNVMCEAIIQQLDDTDITNLYRKLDQYNSQSIALEFLSVGS